MDEGSSLVQPLVGYLMDLYGTQNVFRYLALIAMTISAISLVKLLVDRRSREIPSADNGR
jgi:hypothetical protein